MVIWIFPDAAHQKVLFYPEIFHSLYAVESQKKDRYFSQIQQQPTNSTRSWISSAWQNGALSEHRMVLLSPDVPPSCRQMCPSRQYWQQPANPNRGDARICGLPSWDLQILNFRRRFNQKFRSSICLSLTRN